MKKLYLLILLLTSCSTTKQPPIPPGAKNVMTSRASVAQQQPTIQTNYCTITFNAGIDYSGSNKVSIESTSELNILPFTNVAKYPMNGQDINITFSFTNQARFFRFSYGTN